MCGELYIVYICLGNWVKLSYFLCVFGVKSSPFLGWVGLKMENMSILGEKNICTCREFYEV